MGTTLVAGVFMPDKLVVVHAGDSRCYRLRGQTLEPLTEDHSIVAELVKRGVIRAEDAQEHPFSHIISRSVGPCPELEVEIRIFEIGKEDRFLFCTDGLNNHVKDPVIREMLENSENADDAVKRLLYASLKGGGEDNITVASVFPGNPPVAQ
jgi:protein phosphatase